MPLERKRSARRSQRRKKNAEQIVGINLGNTLGPPELMGNDVISDASNAGSRPSSAADPKRSPDIPRTPHMKRKSISVDKPLYEPGKQRTSLAPKHKQSAKMDVARAMGIMGFNSSRWLECSQNGGSDPKQELDNAQFNRMQELLKRKKQTQREVETGVVKKHDNLTGYKKRTADRGLEKVQEDIMNLHEAYQFLMKKYKLNEKKIQMKSIGYATMLGNQMGGGGHWDLTPESDAVKLGHESTSSSHSGTRLSEDLGQINLNNDTTMDSDINNQVDDIFK